MRAIVAGSTGATGLAITKQLLQDSSYASVTALTRRPVEKSHFGDVGHDKLTIKNFDETINRSSDPNAYDVAYCCLGAAPHTEEADYVIPAKFADYCEKNQIPRVLLISSVGADANSWISYPRTIGRREEYFKQRSFQLSIFRPQFILRGELARAKEIFFTTILPSGFKIDVNTIGKAAVACFKAPQTEKCVIYENQPIKDLAGSPVV